MPLPNSRGRFKAKHCCAECELRLNGFALSLLLDPSPGDAVTKLNLKKVFSTCREKFCSINGAPVCRLLDEGMRQERAMLVQAETKSKAPFGNRNGRPDKSDGLDPQFANLNSCTERYQISRTNHTKPRRTSRRNVLSAVPRARRMIPLTRRLVLLTW